MCGSSQGRSGKVRLWKALSCSSLTGPRGLSPQSLFLGPQLRGQVKQRRQEPGRLPEDHAETQALLPRRQDAERGGGRGGKEEAAAQFPQVSSRASVSPAVM